MKRQISLIAIGFFLLMALANRASAQRSYIFAECKNSVHVGVYDTLGVAYVMPDSPCQWTDSSRINFGGNWPAGFNTLNQGQNVYVVGTAKASEGPRWLYADASANLS